ncbi:hypothetical protein CMI38_02860 [Candidatus Pacearchaeota archaeon]|jgi:hypothetical protein|nr:hypothetical protein [Candidatus Pacearchaeota archaeon]|tara:strand:+ start:7221 stop:7676 length:456 start_codon:yes stop_codon:yes gene_type:complete
MSRIISTVKVGKESLIYHEGDLDSDRRIISVKGLEDWAGSGVDFYVNAFCEDYLLGNYDNLVETNEGSEFWAVLKGGSTHINDKGSLVDEGRKIDYRRRLGFKFPTNIIDEYVEFFSQTSYNGFDSDCYEYEIYLKIGDFLARFKLEPSDE